MIPPSEPAASLDGLKVLVVEDEALLLMSLESLLEELGCTVVASAHRLARALDLAAQASPAAAVLDVNVAGEPVFPLAERLAQRGVKLVFATGYGDAGVAAAWRNWPVVQKPFGREELERALRAAIDRRG